MRNLLLILFSIFSLNSFCQDLTGQVVDGSSGEPLAEVSVSFVGGSTSTDSLGSFRISGSVKEIKFSLLGYLPVTMTVRGAKLLVLMEKNVAELSGVTISSLKVKYRNKGNPAVELIQKVINNKAANRAVAYTHGEQYERMSLSLFNLPPKITESNFFSKYKFMLDTVQGQTFLPVLVEERLDGKEVKGVNILQFIDTAGVKLYVNQLYGHQPDIYENNIFILANQFLSPISDHAPNFYKYFIVDTVDNQVTLEFTPRTKGNLQFEGKIMVSLNNYAVTGCELRLNRQINVTFVRSFAINLDFEGGRLIQSKVKADFGLTNKGWGIYGERVVQYRQQPTGKLQNLPVYAKLYQLEQMPSFKRTMWWLTTITAGYADTGPVQIGPLSQSLSYNSLEGLKLQLGFRTTPKLDSTFYFEGYAAYGTRDHQLKGNAIAYISLNKVAPYRFPNDYFKLSYLYDVDVPGHTFSVTNRPNAISSFQTGKTDYWLYSRITELQYVKDFENHFSYIIGYKNWQQSPAKALVYQLQDGTRINNLTTNELSAHLRYAPHEEIVQGSRRRSSIHNPYPIYDLLVNKSIGNYNYTDIGINIYKRFYLSQAGFTDVTLIGGYVIGQVPFPLLNISLSLIHI